MKLAFLIPTCLALCGSLGNASACNTTLVQISDWSINADKPQTQQFLFQLISKSKKTIKSLDASVIIEDRLGNLLFSSFINKQLLIKPKETFITIDTIIPDEAVDHMQKDSMRAYVCSRSAIFSDGTSQQYD